VLPAPIHCLLHFERRQDEPIEFIQRLFSVKLIDGSISTLYSGDTIYKPKTLKSPNRFRYRQSYLLSPKLAVTNECIYDFAKDEDASKRFHLFRSETPCFVLLGRTDGTINCSSIPRACSGRDGKIRGGVQKQCVPSMYLRAG
jgi:hypothetical protein